MSEAWIMRQDIADQREENRLEPNVPVSYEQLADLGVSVFRFDPKTMLEPRDNGTRPPMIELFAMRMRFVNRDEVRYAPEHLPDYETKLKALSTEYIHEDDEIRLIKDGSGYFDVRNAKDEWVRILCKAGDLIIIPAGIYRRFIVDVSKNYTHVIRFFSGLPKWTPINRPCDENAFRAGWVEKFGRPGGPIRETIFGPADASGENIYVHHPDKFDATVRPVMQKVSETKGKSLLVVCFAAEDLPLPAELKESWCPDCVRAKPTLKREVERVRAKFAAEGGERKLYFIQVGVNAASYAGNPEYFYRKHPFSRISGGVPTVVVWAGDNSGEGIEKQRLDGNVPETWVLKED